MALRGQGRCVNQHAMAFNAVERFAALHFQLIDEMQFVVGLQQWPQSLVHRPGEICILTGVMCSLGNVDLRKRNLVHTLATQVLVRQPLATQMSQGQTFQTVGLVHLQHITLQHGVVHITLHFNPVVGKHMTVVFHVLTQFVFAAVFQPGLELLQDILQRQLRGRVCGVVRQWYVSRMPASHAQTDAHQLRLHLSQ